MEQVSQESTTCSLAETRAKEPPTDANTRTCAHIYTRCTCSLVRHSLRPLDGGIMALCGESKKKMRAVRSQANAHIRTVCWTILYPRRTGCQNEAAIDKST